MAGTALTSPYNFSEPGLIMQDDAFIKNLEVINEGDLVATDTNGFVVQASKTQSAVTQAEGVAFFAGNNTTITSRTGDGTTQKCAIVRVATILGVNSTLVPGLGKGKRVYLGAVGTSTVSNYTCTQTSTNGDALQHVGYVSADGTKLYIFVTQAGIQVQTAGNSNIGYV